jgi:hypothetical protein
MDPITDSNQDPKGNQGGKPVLVTQEEYAAITHLPLQYIRYLCSRTCEKWRCASKFDERDLKRFSKTKVLIWYMPRNAATGQDFPRIVERPEDPLRLGLIGKRRPTKRAPRPEERPG